MADHLDARPDHVAIVVPDLDAAAARWRDQLGGGLMNHFDASPQFRGRQYRFANGGKLEMLTTPSGEEDEHNFVRRFLDRFGARIHHMTLLVPDIHVAFETLDAAGLDVVDRRTDSEHWREGFTRPSQIGGMIVQVAWASHSTDEWAERRGIQREDPAQGAAALLGPRLQHPDLDRAREVWTLLGAEVVEDGGALHCTWRDAPLSVEVVEGEPAGPVAMRMSGTDELPGDPAAGPPVAAE